MLMKLNPGLQKFFFVHLEFKKEKEDVDQKDFFFIFLPLFCRVLSAIIGFLFMSLN